MAQQARNNERQAMTIAPRSLKPAIFGGSDASWRTLCDLYPSAETPEVVMAVVEYCAVRKLDPFKKPVHVVAMYNSKLRRKVQVVMQGINEVEITASRTGAWAGIDLPQWGPDVDRVFKGSFEDSNGATTNVEKRLIYPAWCAVTVYRLVGGERRAFTEQLFFDECYATSAFRSEVPNERWCKAPRQMLHKCTKAAVLRAAFPEEGMGYTAEEMEDHETDAGGVTIEGNVDHGGAGTTERDRRAETYAPQTKAAAPGGEAAGGDPLDEDNGTRFLRALSAALMAAETEARVVEIEAHPRVRAALKAAPTLIKDQITRMLSTAHERVRKVVEQSAPVEEERGDPGFDPDGGGVSPGEGDGTTWPDDPIAELLAEVAAMDLDALDGLHTNKAWAVKMRAIDFPPDEDRIRDAAAERRAILNGSKAA